MSSASHSSASAVAFDRRLLERATYGHLRLTVADLADVALASAGYCLDAGPALRDEVNRQLQPTDYPAQAALELHSVNTADGLTVVHCFPVLEGLSQTDGQDDIVFDATYKQFLPCTYEDNKPNLYVGTRQDMMRLMIHEAVHPETYCLYMPESLLPRLP